MLHCNMAASLYPRWQAGAIVSVVRRPKARTHHGIAASTSRVRELKPQGMRPVDFANTLKIGRASVYRVLGTSAD
jgi:hypothetical protein